MTETLAEESAESVIRRLTEEVKTSNDPFVSQFIRALPDGPVPFHYPAEPYEKDLEL